MYQNGNQLPKRKKNLISISFKFETDATKKCSSKI